MSVYRNSLAQLIELTLRVPLHDWKGGICTGAPTTAQVIDTIRRDEADDYFQNTVPVSRVKIVSTTDGQAPKGEERLAADFANGTALITVSPVFSVAPAAGDTYAILSEYQWDEVKAAINVAIEAVVNDLLIPKIDETVEIQDSTYEYVIPTGFAYIHKLSQENDNGDFPEAIPPDQYGIVHDDIPKIHFYVIPSGMKTQDHYVGSLWAESDLADGKKLRIEGFSRQDKLVIDDDICFIDPNYVIYQAAAFLHAARIRQPAGDPDNHRTQFDVCQAMADQFKARALRAIRLPPDSKKVEF